MRDAFQNVVKDEELFWPSNTHQEKNINIILQKLVTSI